MTEINSVIVVRQYPSRANHNGDCNLQDSIEIIPMLKISDDQFYFCDAGSPPQRSTKIASSIARMKLRDETKQSTVNFQQEVILTIRELNDYMLEINRRTLGNRIESLSSLGKALIHTDTVTNRVLPWLREYDYLSLKNNGMLKLEYPFGAPYCSYYGTGDLSIPTFSTKGKWIPKLDGMGLYTYVGTSKVEIVNSITRKKNNGLIRGYLTNSGLNVAIFINGKLIYSAIDWIENAIKRKESQSLCEQLELLNKSRFRALS